MIFSERQTFPAAGTLLFGRSMIAQLAPELEHLGVEQPVMIASIHQKKAARKAARALNAAAFPSIPLFLDEVPPKDADALLFAGDPRVLEAYQDDPRPKVFLALSGDDLVDLEPGSADIVVLDEQFVAKSPRLPEFFRRFGKMIGGGLLDDHEAVEIPRAFDYVCRTTIIAGHEALKILPDLMIRRHITRPLVLTDRGIRAVGLLDRLLETMSGDLEVFDDIPPDSDSRVVNRISALFAETDRNGLIALGGGSVLDTAKGVYLNVSLGTANLRYYAGSGRIPVLSTPFIAIPTTSGTGSEVTKAAVIADAQEQRKVLYISPNLQPDFAVLDASLTASLPPFLTSITGMDALSHAVEAFTCLGKNPLSDRMALGAVGLIGAHLLHCIDDPQNTEHRMALALASNFAGQAFSNSMVGMVHSIGHSVGAVCHVPHGSCMSVLLPHALEYNYQAIRDYLAQLLPVLTGIAKHQGDQEAKARRVIQTIREMNRSLREKTGGRHPERLRDAVNREGEPLVDPSHFDAIARTTLGDASIVYNPVELRYDDIIGVLERAY